MNDGATFVSAGKDDIADPELRRRDRHERKQVAVPDEREHAAAAGTDQNAVTFAEERTREIRLV